jgi:hypothetical protein
MSLQFDHVTNPRKKYRRPVSLTALSLQTPASENRGSTLLSHLKGLNSWPESLTPAALWPYA